jgi:hypothetical protein
MKISRYAVWSGALLLAAGCADLEVVNPNAPDTERVVAEPEDLLGLIGSSYNTWFFGSHWFGGGPALSVAADAHTASWGNFAMQDFSREPRVAINNSPSYNYSYVVEDPWSQNYGTLKAVNDPLAAMAAGIDLGEDRALGQAFAKFMQGLAHGQLALIYDQAFIYDETVTPDDIEAGLELQPYSEVMAAAIGFLEESIALSGSAEFTTQVGWINEQAITSDVLEQLGHSYIARYLAGVARTPAERAAVDWNTVISHAEQGITEDFGPFGDGCNNWCDALKAWGGTYLGWSRLDLRFYGMAHSGGEYQEWIGSAPANRTPFLIDTPDRRITGDTPDSDGTHVRFTKTWPFRAERGSWHFSNYADRRWAGGFNNYSTNFVDQMVEFMPEELRFLIAEGYLRTDREAQAADLLNITREAAGLPPVTAAGVTDSPDCVPVEPSATRECGSLLRALHWEKWVETYHTGMPTEFTDARGWGFLQSGTAIHLPVPGSELQVLELPIYTFGGDQGGVAPSIGVAGGGWPTSVAPPTNYFDRFEVSGPGATLRPGRVR